MSNNNKTTPVDKIAVKWKMIDTKTFIGNSNGYDLLVKLGGLAPYWAILKDNTIVEEAYYHSPTKCELSAKVQCERCLNKLINQT